MRTREGFEATTVTSEKTDSVRFGERAIDEKLVKRTWRGSLDNEEELPNERY